MCPRLDQGDISLNGLKVLVQALDKNRFLTDMHVSTMEEDIVAKIDQLNNRNKSQKHLPTQQQQQQQQQARPSGDSKVISLWFKGQVHIGDAPPSSEPGWTRFTFDAGTTFAGAPNPAAVAAKPSSPAAPALAAAKPTSAGASSVAAALAKPVTTTATTTPVKSPVAAPQPSVSTARPTAPNPVASAANIPPPTAASVAKPAAAKVLFKVQAIYDYLDPGEDEVAFKTGDVIEVSKVLDEDWYMGRVERTNKSGQVPANHVQKV